jgi:hypothetical protein
MTEPTRWTDQEVPEEVTRVAGCDCGGMIMHPLTCAIWGISHEERVAAMRDASDRLRQWTSQRIAVPPAEVARLEAENENRHAEQRAQSKVIGSLLIGGTILFGKRVELAWPDGLPNGLTEESLKDVGQNMLDQA